MYMNKLKLNFLAPFVLLTFLLLCTGCKRTPPLPPPPEETPIPLPKSASTINVYIENSGSMDGYVDQNTTTEFKLAIRDLFVMLKHYYGEEIIKVHFINSEIKETDTQRDLVKFATEIHTPFYKMRDQIGRDNSNMNNVFKMILNKSDKETISILFSDCIYSIKGKDAEGLLSDQKSLTKDAFLSRWKQDSLKLATTIVKMKSKFKGKYFDKDNAPTILTGQERPYYICVIGNNDVMFDFNNKIPLEKGKIEGFDNKYIISSGEADDIYYSVLLSTDNVGRFKASRRASTKEYVHGIEDVNMKARGRDSNGCNKLTFAVAVDLKNIAAEDDYLMNPDNYTLSDNNFRIKEVKTVERNNINASDWIRICEANPTHLIVLEATGTATSNVKISLKKQMPQWIEQTHIVDDKRIKDNLDKTFGIKYLIEGIAEAYQTIYPNDKNFFEFEIEIKNK